MSVQHIEVPSAMTQMTLDNELEKGDKIVYAAIRKYMNSDTRQCFPSISTIKKQFRIGQTRITGAIDRLIKVGLLEAIKEEGKRTIYHFPKTEFDKQFEMFTMEFLELDMPIEIKEYYMDIQPYLYDKETGVGKCSYNNSELSRRTGWSPYLIKKYNTWLIEHNYLEERMSETKKDEGGFPVIVKSFNLASLNQASLWIKAVNQQLIKNAEDINKNTEDIESIKQELNDLRAWKAQMERQMALKRNHVDEAVSYEF